MTEYKEITSELLHKFEEILPGRLFAGETISEGYGIDETPLMEKHMPEAVALVQTTDEVAALMRLCNENHVAVTARGSGTGLTGASVAVTGGLVISLEKMNRILEIDEDNMVVHLESGVQLGTLQSVCEERGLFYPPDPGEKQATIGGNAATNAGGMRAVQYGTTRDYVLGATVVLPTGEILRLGAETIKNNSANHLLPMLIGSEGIFGIITELTLRLRPLPRESMSILGAFESAKPALQAVSGIRRSFSPRSLEFMEADLVLTAQKMAGQQIFPDQIDGEPVGFFLLITFDGRGSDELMADLEEAGGQLLENGAMDVLVIDNPNAGKNIFAVRDSLLDVIKKTHLLVEEIDVALPVTLMGDYLDDISARCMKYGLRLRVYGHAGDGNLHIYFCDDGPDREEFKKKTDLLLDEAYAKAAEMGGVLSGEHGIGYVKRKYSALFSNEKELHLIREIKKVVDPNLILNPLKVV